MTFWKNDDDSNDDLEIEEVIIITPVKKINYLNNKDMLKEIHRSKNSFCEYIDPKYSDYDVIVEDLQEIFLTEVQEKGKIARAARLSAQAFDVRGQAYCVCRDGRYPFFAFQLLEFFLPPPRRAFASSPWRNGRAGKLRAEKIAQRQKRDFCRGVGVCARTLDCP